MGHSYKDDVQLVDGGKEKAGYEDFRAEFGDEDQ